MSESIEEINEDALTNKSPISQLIKNWLDNERTPGFNAVENLISLSECIEREQTEFWGRDPDPFDERIPKKVPVAGVYADICNDLMEHSKFILNLIITYITTRSDDINCTTLTLRFLCSALNSCLLVNIFEEFENDTREQFYNKIFEWALSDSSPMNIYSTYIAGHITKSDDQVIPQRKLTYMSLISQTMTRLEVLNNQSNENMKSNWNIHDYTVCFDEGSNANVRDMSMSQICGVWNLAIPMKEATQQRLLIFFLRHIAEFETLMPSIYTSGVLPLITSWLRGERHDDIRLTFEALRLLTKLLCHRVIYIEFYDRMDGIQLLLSIPRPSVAANAISFCMYNLLYYMEIVEKVIQMSSQKLEHLIKVLLWIIETCHPTARSYGMMCINCLIRQPLPLKIFEKLNGPRYILNSLAVLPTMCGAGGDNNNGAGNSNGVGSGNINNGGVIGSNIGTGASGTITSSTTSSNNSNNNNSSNASGTGNVPAATSKKNNARKDTTYFGLLKTTLNTMKICLEQSLINWSLETENAAAVVSASAADNTGLLPFPSETETPFSKMAVACIPMAMKLQTWKHPYISDRSNIIKVIYSKSGLYEDTFGIYHEMINSSLDILSLLCVSNKFVVKFLDFSESDTKATIKMIFGILMRRPKSVSPNHVKALKSILFFLSILCCRPLQGSLRVPLIPNKTPRKRRFEELDSSLNLETVEKIHVSEQRTLTTKIVNILPSSQTFPVVHGRGLTTNTATDNQLFPARNTTPSSAPVANSINNNASINSSAAANKIGNRQTNVHQELQNKLWNLIRCYNAIPKLLKILEVPLSPLDTVAVRTWVCYVLSGMSRCSDILLMLRKLPTFNKGIIENLMKETVTPERMAEHAEFCTIARRLIRDLRGQSANYVDKVCGSGVGDLRPDQVRKMEIVSRTQIQWDNRELLHLIYQHLQQTGFNDVADLLRVQASLPIIQPDNFSLYDDDSFENNKSQNHQNGNNNTSMKNNSIISVSSDNNCYHNHSYQNLIGSTATTGTPFLQTPTRIPNTFTSGRQQTKYMASSTPKTSISTIMTPATTSATTKNDFSIPPTTSLIVQTPTTNVPFKPKLYRDSIKQSIIMTKSSLPPGTVGALAGGGGGINKCSNAKPTTLNDIVETFLRTQHAQCPNPISICPKFSLHSKHVCPAVGEWNRPTDILSYITKRSYDSTHHTLNNRMLHRYVHRSFKPRVILNESDVFADDRFSDVFCFAKGLEDGLFFAGENSGIVFTDIDLAQASVEIGEVNNATSNLENTKNGRLLMVSSAFSKRSGGVLTLFNVENRCFDPTKMKKEKEYQYCGYSEFSKTNDTKFIITQDKVARVIDVETGNALHTCSNEDTIVRSMRNVINRATFSYDDNLVLSYGTLWDVRCSPREPVVNDTFMHRFDNLEDIVSGVFHPNGLEVIIGSAVWDIRTYRLLQNISALKSSRIIFNEQGDFFYTYKDSMNSYISNPVARGQNIFQCFDSRDYSVVATVNTNKVILSLTVDPKDLGVAVIESNDEGGMHAQCRVFSVGFKWSSSSSYDIDDDVAGGEDKEPTESDLEIVMDVDLNDIMYLSDSDDEDDDDEDDDDNGSSTTDDQAAEGDEDNENYLSLSGSDSDRTSSYDNNEIADLMDSDDSEFDVTDSSDYF